MSSGLLIRDLIEVPPVRTVIRLQDGREQSEEVARSFVFTDEVSSHVTVIAGSLAAAGSGRGQGYFLQGDFGSGKSHFLAALSAWLEGGPAREVLSSGHEGLAALSGKTGRFLPVAISLIDYRSDTPLEQIVTHAVREALDQDRETGAGAGLQRREAFQAMIRAAQAAGHAGLVLLIDELSEFFRSKPTAQSLNEDARVLQLLGELAAAEPLWIVAAVQESIEATGDLSKAIFRKIRDRYPVKLALSTIHIRSLIGGRLVRRKPGADQEIFRLHEAFSGRFKTFGWDHQAFRTAYPVHPTTIGLLEGLGDLFSQARGIVDFVYYRIAGDPRREIPGILDRPATELLAPDSLYDHFADRLAELSAFNLFPRRIVPHLDQVIAERLSGEQDQALGRRLVRILAIYAVHPTAATPSVIELAELAACNMDFGADMNARFVSEVILDPLVDGSRFLVREPPTGGVPADAVYRIVREEDPRRDLESRLDHVVRELGDADPRALVEALEALPVSESWPGRVLWEDGARREITWQLTTRRAAARLLHRGDDAAAFAARLAEDVEEGLCNFAVVVAPCARDEEPPEVVTTIPHTAVWVIRQPDAARESLLSYLGARTLAARLRPGAPAEADLIPMVQERAQRLAAAAFQEALAALYQGEFTESGIRVDPVVRQLRHFDKLLQAAGESLLSRRYPDHSRAAPHRIAPARRHYERLLADFVSQGSVSLPKARDRGLTELIDGLAVPLGLVEIRGGSYLFSPAASDHALLADLLALLHPAEPTALPDVMAGLTGGSFGLPRDTALFLIAALAVGGVITLRRSGRAVPLEMIALSAVEKAQEITLGELIGEADRATLLAECTFLPSVAKVETFGMRQQRDAWRDVLRFRETVEKLTEQLRTVLARYSGYSVLEPFDLEGLERKLQAAQTLASTVPVSYGAKQGLERFLQLWRASGLAGDDFRRLQRLRELLESRGEELMFVGHYARHPAVEQAVQARPELAAARGQVLAALADPETTILADGRERLGELFALFRDAYAADYGARHAAYNDRLAPPELSRFSLRAVEALERLAAIETLDRPPGLEPFLRELREPALQPCRRTVREELLRSPLCPCGFRPGQPDPPAPVSPEGAAENHLVEYVRILSGSGVLEPVEARAFALQDAEPAASERLRRMAAAGREGRLSPASLVNSLDQETIGELGRALQGRVSVHRRSLGELIKSLAGRRLPGDRVLQIVRQWLSGDEGPGDGLFALEDSGEAGAAGADKAARREETDWWPQLHGELFSRGRHAGGGGAGSGAAARAHAVSEALSRRYPADRMAELFRLLDAERLMRFVAEERFHTDAVRTAWLTLAERALGGSQPAFESLASRHADPEVAEKVTGLLAATRSFALARSGPYPARLAARIPAQIMQLDPWATTELQRAALKAVREIGESGSDWLAGLSPVPRIELQDGPVVIVLDGVAPDVWTRATDGLSGRRDAAAELARTQWHRLEAQPRTADALAALFGFSGDTLEELDARGVPYLTVAGNEERGLAAIVESALEADRGLLVRVAMLDRAAHAGTASLAAMADILRGLLERELEALVGLGLGQSRRLILTTDHGMSLGREGLSHGEGGVYEEAVFRACWPRGPG